MENNLFFPKADRRVMKVICVALPAGVVLMALVAVFIGTDEPTPMDSSTAMIVLRLVHVVIIGVVLLADKFFYPRILDGKFPLSRFQSGGDSFSTRYRVATIVKLALFEGAALYGNVLVIIASTGGWLRADPSMYLHLIPVLMLIGAARSSYPSDQKIADLSRLYPT
jgi:hypothetical protein